MQNRKYHKKPKKSGTPFWYTLGNILNLPMGIPLAISWFCWGLICYITIIGIPFGEQCFKMGQLVLWPFGKKVVYRKTGPTNTLFNIIWLIFNFWEAVLHFLVGIFSVGSPILYWGWLGLYIQQGAPELYIPLGIYFTLYIPFALQQFKFAKLALFPFSAVIKKA